MKIEAGTRLSATKVEASDPSIAALEKLFGDLDKFYPKMDPEGPIGKKITDPKIKKKFKAIYRQWQDMLEAMHDMLEEE